MILSDNYDVDAYTNPVDGLASVKPKLDDLMPQMNGREFYKVKEADPVVDMRMKNAYEVTYASTGRASLSTQNSC